MPDSLPTPRRTAAGDAAVARHASEFETGLRVVLAAIDGKRSTAVLKARFGALLDVDIALAKLVAAGMVEAPAQPASSPPVPTAAPASTPAMASAVLSDSPPAAFEIASARKMAVRGITECLGPRGDNLALQIERCKALGDFAPLHAKVVAIVKAERGTAEVERFLRWSPVPPLP